MYVVKSILLIFFVVFLAPLGLSAEPLERVSLQFQWKHQFEYAGFYAAREKGYYAEEGLDVEFRELTSGIDSVAEVIEGRADFGITYSSIIADYFTGKPVVMLANIFKHSALVLLSQEELVLPSDLAGKRVMGNPAELGNSGITTMLHRFGMTQDDFEIVPQNHSLDDFISGRVDATTAFITNQPYLLNELGIKYNILNPASYGSLFYDVNLFTSRHKVQSNPRQVEAFRRASIRGWQYALENSEEIVQIILDQYNSQGKSRAALKYEAELTKSLITGRVIEVGSIDCGVLEEMSRAFMSQGTISPGEQLNFNKLLFQQTCVQEGSAGLTFEQRQYLAKRGPVTVCVDPDWMPYEMIKDGKHVGMSADYLQIIESYIQTPIVMVPTTSWTESLEFAQDRKCDIFSLAMETPERKKYMNFTQPYLVLPMVIATNQDQLFVTGLEEVRERKLGMVKGYAYTEILKNQYPAMKIIEYENIHQGLQAVDRGDVYGFVGSLATVGYQIQKNFFGTLKISGRIDMDWELGVGVRNDDLMLLSIFDQAIGSIEPKTHQEILNQWMGILYEQRVDYTLLWKIVGGVVVVFVFTLYRYRETKQHNRVLEELSTTDVLTNVYNRRYLDTSVQSAMDMAKRYKTPFSLVLLDLDDFKEINDRYGHASGDCVLQKIGEILSTQSRSNDVVGRWGGEEFLIVCHHCRADAAVNLAQKLCQMIAEEIYTEGFSVTASFGVAECDNQDSHKSLFAKVDDALYQAKEKGKNRVIAAD
ncbi:MAG: diguanylate cyclase [Desulfobulbaceae bacterium]|uniref:diguanylate cyclase n=1 Tax=Candidatus Desulfatifera sulfidica TaxID=2841691 RepID=A0A8J6N5H1_9BACT|nr:diguanylate cyclase [Candidatus Desulfatifera sulfidica]